MEVAPGDERTDRQRCHKKQSDLCFGDLLEMRCDAIGEQMYGASNHRDDHKKANDQNSRGQFPIVDRMMRNAQKECAPKDGRQGQASERVEKLLHFKFGPMQEILLQVPKRLTFVSDGGVSCNTDYIKSDISMTEIFKRYE